MTCPRSTDADVADRLQLAALAQAEETGLPFGLARITTQKPNNGALIAMIERRASKLRFSNAIQRQRYISRHSSGFSTGDAK